MKYFIKINPTDNWESEDQGINAGKYSGLEME